MIRFIAMALAPISLWASSAYGCSVVRGYHVPGNLELAGLADTIVVGTVETFERADDLYGRIVVVRPTLLLKGAALPNAVRMTGYSREVVQKIVREGPSGDRNVDIPPPTRSNPRELREANPDAFMGGCTRYMFEPGMKLVLFLRRDKAGELAFMSYPFARVSEDVPSDDALWVKAVRIYIGIAALPKAERRAAMISRRDALRAAGDADSLLLAQDLDVELNTKKR